MPEGPELVDWYARHVVAMIFQVLSIAGSSLIILSFVYLKSRRSAFHYQVLCLNVADIIWTTSHFINHAQSLAYKKVIPNGPACIAMGFFTHVGIGWELSWMMVIALYTAAIVYYGSQGRTYNPSNKVKIIVSSIAWGFPLLWWGGVGLPMNAYDNSTGYFCWVKFNVPLIATLFSDGPLIICCILVTCCYGYVAYSLFRFSLEKGVNTGTKTFSKEIKRAVLYIFVYIAWVHPYLAITIVTMTGGTPTRGLFLYFLAMTNSMGLLNFLAYGHSEQWFSELKFRCGCGPDPHLLANSVLILRPAENAHSTITKNLACNSANDTSSDLPV